MWIKPQQIRSKLKMESLTLKFHVTELRVSCYEWFSSRKFSSHQVLVCMRIKFPVLILWESVLESPCVEQSRPLLLPPSGAPLKWPGHSEMLASASSFTYEHTSLLLVGTLTCVLWNGTFPNSRITSKTHSHFLKTSVLPLDEACSYHSLKLFMSFFKIHIALACD